MRHALLLTALLIATNVMATGEPLLIDAGIVGNSRQCKYAGGKTFIFPVTASCPATAPEPMPEGTGRGYLKSIVMEGGNRFCVYRVGGVDKAVSVTLNENCPATRVFE
ncbi:MAG TPA: hypothetical protein VL381_01370 [Rhodocyclaceae bacterium]|jgi:hypothetical protein|nr:hypothetical protein [Rhodocyclaceae bacterium]